MASQAKMLLPPPSPSQDYKVKETAPLLGGVGSSPGGKLSSTYDLVEQMHYLYVRIVKARNLPAKDATTSCSAYVEVSVGAHKGSTPHIEKKSDPEWNQSFAFSADRIASPKVDIVVKDKELGKEDFVGRVLLDLRDLPTRVSPDCPLAPQWYTLENLQFEKVKGEIMLAAWKGTQADKLAFSEAWHSDALAVPADKLPNTRTHTYLSPKLWYLRIHVIEAKDLHPSDKTRTPEAFVKAMLEDNAVRTRTASKSSNPMWNEELMLVAAEPFDEYLTLSVEDKVESNKVEVLGKASIPLRKVDRRVDYVPVANKWYDVEKTVTVVEGETKKETKLVSKVLLSICLEGGYHVLDESVHYSSDRRPTEKQPQNSKSIAFLKVGIQSARGLLPMKTKDGRGTTDAYCVAKYGEKWITTRTVVDSLAPQWNQLYVWEVYDPCTVLMVAVFDNGYLTSGEEKDTAKDSKIGKVRIRLSTLECNIKYTHSYPLISLHPTGLKKMGELQLNIELQKFSLLEFMLVYTKPLFPKMHYSHPLSNAQNDSLRRQAVQVVSTRLGRAEPPLRKEVVEYMLDVDSYMWSMRKGRANFFRLVGAFGWLTSIAKWFHKISSWTSPTTTVLVHILLVILVLYPELILPTVFLYLFLIGIWKYKERPRHPPHMDTKLSLAENVLPDDLDEEFDENPSTRADIIVRARYNRLRNVTGSIQMIMGDLATQGERLQLLLSWRDPRATGVFVIFCLVAAVVLYVTPFRAVALTIGLYLLRHPRFRERFPSVPLNFFRRLPARTDSLF